MQRTLTTTPIPFGDRTFDVTFDFIDHVLVIETSGGVSPIRCYGHKKGDAIRMKNLIETYQSDYYRATGSPTTSTTRISPSCTRRSVVPRLLPSNSCGLCW
jgi:hypothetical protein